MHYQISVARRRRERYCQIRAFCPFIAWNQRIAKISIKLNALQQFEKSQKKKNRKKNRGVYWRIAQFKKNACENLLADKRIFVYGFICYIFWSLQATGYDEKERVGNRLRLRLANNYYSCHYASCISIKKCQQVYDIFRNGQYQY